jgi:hypothetical protein
MTSIPPALATPMKHESLPKSIPITGAVAIFPTVLKISNLNLESDQVFKIKCNLGLALVAHLPN